MCIVRAIGRTWFPSLHTPNQLTCASVISAGLNGTSNTQTDRNRQRDHQACEAIGQIYALQPTNIIVNTLHALIEMIYEILTFQSTGVATFFLSVSFSESIARRISLQVYITFTNTHSRQVDTAYCTVKYQHSLHCHNITAAIRRSSTLEKHTHHTCLTAQVSRQQRCAWESHGSHGNGSKISHGMGIGIKCMGMGVKTWELSPATVNSLLYLHSNIE